MYGKVQTSAEEQLLATLLLLALHVGPHFVHQVLQLFLSSGDSPSKIFETQKSVDFEFCVVCLQECQEIVNFRFYSICIWLTQVNRRIRASQDTIPYTK